MVGIPVEMLGFKPPRAPRGPPGGRQGAENWGRFLVHPYARRTSSQDPYHQVGGTPRRRRIGNCFLRFRTVAKLWRVLGTSLLTYLLSWLAGCLSILYSSLGIYSNCTVHNFPHSQTATYEALLAYILYIPIPR